MGKNAFDELLESVTDLNHRKALAEVAEVVPGLKEGYLRQSDYSRKMDEFRREREGLQDRLKFADSYDEWWKDNWIPDALGEGKGATKSELAAIRDREAARREVEELQKQVSLGGNVTFDELSGHVTKLMADQGVARKADLEAFNKTLETKEAGVQHMLAGYSHMLTKAPVLVHRHAAKFGGEELDLDGLVKYAADNNHTDLTKAYTEFVAPRVKELEDKAIEARIEEAKKTAREEALKERGMSQSSMPDDNRSPSMGHLEARLAGIKPQGGDVEIPEDAPLGSGVIARLAARSADRS